MLQTLERQRLLRSSFGPESHVLAKEFGNGDTAPSLQMSAWQGACAVEVQLIHDEPGVTSLDQRAIVWGSVSLEARLYPLVLGGPEKHSGHEYEVTLWQRPKTNVLRYAWRSRNVARWHQPLTPRAGLTRPEHYCDSEAFYAPWSGDYTRMGGENYRAGKFGHLHRSYAVDAVGQRVWCEHLFVGAELHVITPWEFLQSAVYPVKVDPTFGYTTIGGANAGQFFVNRMYGPVAAPASNGIVDSFFGYVWPAGTGRLMKGVLVLANTHGTETIVTNGVTPGISLDAFTGAAGWAEAPYSVKPSVTASTNYITMACGGGTDPWGVIYIDAAPANSSVYHSGNNYTTPVAPTAGSQEAERPSYYESYTVSSADPIPSRSFSRQFAVRRASHY